MSAKLLREMENDPDNSYTAMAVVTHARFKQKRRWKAAEQFILRHPRVALTYARCLIKGRWPEGELIFFQDPQLTLEYYDHIMSYERLTRDDCKRLSKAMESGVNHNFSIPL